MDGRYSTQLTTCYQTTINIGDSYTDNLLFMLQVVPLLLNCRIEQDYLIAYKVHNFFIDELGLLFVLVLCTCTLCCQ